jgi:hypothetical protein
MQRYKNLQGNSGVRAFGIGPDYIDVAFVTGEKYRYDSDRPGARDVAAMQALAVAGQGLATYINTHVRDNFAKKL